VCAQRAMGYRVISFKGAGGFGVVLGLQQINGGAKGVIKVGMPDLLMNER
jgi:hypothetical protein